MDTEGSKSEYRSPLESNLVVLREKYGQNEFSLEEATQLLKPYNPRAHMKIEDQSRLIRELLDYLVEKEKLQQLENGNYSIVE